MSMIVIQQEKGQKFINRGEKIQEVSIILKGKVAMRTKNDEFIMEKGAVIGLMSCAAGMYDCDYVALEDTILVTYSYTSRNDLKEVFNEQPQYIYAFLHASKVTMQTVIKRYEMVTKLSRDIYLFIMRHNREYAFLCKKYELNHAITKKFTDINPLKIKSSIPQWRIDYENELIAQPQEIMQQFYGNRQDITIGEILAGSEVMIKAIGAMEEISEYIMNKADMLLSPDGDDLLAEWFRLAKHMSAKGLDISHIQKMVKELQSTLVSYRLVDEKLIKDRFSQFWQFDFEDYAAQQDKEDTRDENEDSADGTDELAGTDYFEYILSYAGYDEDRKAQICQAKDDYSLLVKEKPRSTETMQAARNFTDIFYDIYENAFINSLHAEKVSSIMMLFFNFGFLDAGLVGEEKLNELAALSDKIKETESDHVYTAYEWLMAIYEGKKETSKNEFGLDYQASLRELRKANKITAEEEKNYKIDRERMVRFEITNMLKTGCRITSGKTMIFSPVLDGSEITKPAEDMWVSPKSVYSSIDKIRQVDYSCFYREVLFYDKEHDNCRFFIQKEVLPDIILMPVIGSRGIMWQENVGADRESPARMLFPVMSVLSLDDEIMDNVGRYRWEMCRKLQGVRWNDISEHSLTSEYYDYIQYYKKNRNLSAAVKEKIKSALSRAKGSYREVFVTDYVNWIKYESQGNFRVNKVVREIMSKYIPFTADIRYHLMENPLYRSAFSVYEHNIIQIEKKYRNTLKKYKDDGGTLTQDMMDTLHFYQK